MLENIASYIEHTLLKAEATKQQIKALCREAEKYGFYAVCLNSSYVPLAAAKLQGSKVKICSVAGFPLGAVSTKTKAFEAREAVESGADEIDMVINIGALLDADHAYVVNDIKAVVRAACGAPVKVIIETGLLSDEQKRLACVLAVKGGASFVKTSTGFGPGGASVADIKLMRQAAGPAVGIKAAGGVRTAQAARLLIEAGATRIGTSAGPAIIGS